MGAGQVLHKKLHPCRLDSVPFLCNVVFMLRCREKNEQSKECFMKKLIASVIGALLILSTLSAQEEGAEEKSKVKYSTNINLAITYPWAGKLSVTEVIKVPVLNFDNPFMRGNNIKFKLGAELTPVTVEGKFDVVWTPLAFLEVYGGASIGSGWTLAGWHGLALNQDVFGTTHKVPINFKKAFYTANLGAALQFDLGAIIPTDWTHIIARVDQYFLYRGVTGVDPLTSWVFQNDDGENRNGLTYCASYVLGYQMPLPMNMIAFRLETEKTFFKVPTGADKSIWGEDRYNVVFGPIISFKPIDQLTIMLIAQWKTAHNYTVGDLKTFYQKRTIDKSKLDKIIFKRVGIIFDVNLPNN